MSCLFLLWIASRFTPQSSHANITQDHRLPTVIIDAGHGGEDGGTIGVNGSYEKNINLSIAKKLELLLRASGFQTVMTRSRDELLYDKNADYEGRKKALDMQARLDICARYDNAVFISIHQNSFVMEKYCGLQVYYSENNQASSLLAQEIQHRSSLTVCPQNDRKIKPAGSSIFLLHKLNMPAVLVECGFLSNRQECQMLSQDSYQTRLAMLLCASLSNFLSN